MRILVIASEVPPVTSGVARTVGSLVDGLGDRGHEVETMSGADWSHLTVGEFRLTGFVGRVGRLRRALGRFDVVNLHGPLPTVSDIFFAARASVPNAARPPLVYTHHFEVHFTDWTLALPALAYRGVHRILARSADRVVVSSASYRELLGLDARTCDIIPWGLDLARFRAAGLGSRRPRVGPLRVLVLGQLRAYKGVRVAIDAVRNLPGVALTVAGDGPLMGRLLESASGCRNVRVVGRVEDDRLPDLFAAHDVVALPSLSRQEAFGLALVEGMAAGCVPVASDLPGVRDVAGPTGVLVRPNRPDDLRDALAMLSERQPLVEALGRASRSRVAEFDLPRWLDRYEATLMATAARAAPGGLGRKPRRWPQLLARPDAIAHRTGAGVCLVAFVNRASRERMSVRTWPPQPAPAWADELAVEVLATGRPRLVREGGRGIAMVALGPGPLGSMTVVVVGDPRSESGFRQEDFRAFVAGVKPVRDQGATAPLVGSRS